MNEEERNDLISQGTALMASQNYPEAKKCFEKAVEEDSQSFEAYTNLGNACATLQQNDEAMDAFKKALIIKPDSGETFFSLGNVCLIMGDNLKAIEYYNQAEAAGYKTAQMYQIMAGIFYASGDTIQALRNISRAVIESPLDGKLRLFKARIYLADNKYDEALATLDEMEKVLPDAFEPYDLKAQIYLGRSQYDDALKVSEDGFSRFPGDANLALSRLKVLVECRKDDEAASLIAKMKETGLYDKTLKDSSIQESILLLNKNDIPGAAAVLTSANDALEDDPDIMYILMTIYSKSGDFEHVLPLADKLTNMNAGSLYTSTARFFHAQALEQSGKADEAKAEYKVLTRDIRSLTIAEPSFYEGYVFRLLSHARLGEYDKALELADYMANLYPERADAHAFRYYIYKLQGNTAGAEKEKGLVKQFSSDFIM